MPKRSTLRLTKRFVERLKAGGKDAIFWNRDLAGFGMRVTAGCGGGPHADARRLSQQRDTHPALDGR